MAETFSPVCPRARCGIPSLASAIKVCGLAAPKTAAAAADFRNERLLTVASVGSGGSNRLVSSTIVRINILPWLIPIRANSGWRISTSIHVLKPRPHWLLHPPRMDDPLFHDRSHFLQGHLLDLPDAFAGDSGFLANLFQGFWRLVIKT